MYSSITMQLVTITTKGQVTIPVRIREKLGLEIGDQVVFEEDNKSARVSRAPDFFSFRGALKGRALLDKKQIYKSIGANLAKRYLKTHNR